VSGAAVVEPILHAGFVKTEVTKEDQFLQFKPGKTLNVAIGAQSSTYVTYLR
jgi:hypothetical protein